MYNSHLSRWFESQVFGSCSLASKYVSCFLSALGVMDVTLVLPCVTSKRSLLHSGNIPFTSFDHLFGPWPTWNGSTGLLDSRKVPQVAPRSIFSSASDTSPFLPVLDRQAQQKRDQHREAQAAHLRAGEVHGIGLGVGFQIRWI